MKTALRVVGAGLLVVGVLALLALFLNARQDPAEVPVIDASGRPADGVRVRVEVLNAGGVSGLAGAATERLRDAGFDVVGFGNAAEWSEDSSRVVDRIGNPEMAEAVANALGIRNVLSEPDSSLYVDVSVLLGGEWSAPEVADVRDSDAMAWWDPRGWFR